MKRFCLAILAFVLSSSPHLFGAPSSPQIKSAGDYFHGGAHKYVAGRIQEAAIELKEGLTLYPSDPKLKSLAGLLDKLKDQQQQQGDNGNPQDQDAGKEPAGDEEKENKEREKQDGDKGKEGDNEDQKASDDAKDSPEPKQEDPADGKKPAGAEVKKAEQKEESAQAMEPKPGELSQEAAERLLDAYQDDEKKEHKQMRSRGRKPVKVEEDW